MSVFGLKKRENAARGGKPKGKKNRAVKPDNNYMVYLEDVSKAGNKAHGSSSYIRYLSFI